MIHLKKLAFSFVNLNIILSEKDRLVGKWIRVKVKTLLAGRSNNTIISIKSNHFYMNLHANGGSWESIPLYSSQHTIRVKTQSSKAYLTNTRTINEMKSNNESRSHLLNLKQWEGFRWSIRSTTSTIRKQLHQ